MKYHRTSSHFSLINVKLFMCLIKHHSMKAYGGVEVQLHPSFASALDGGEWSASRPGSSPQG